MRQPAARQLAELAPDLPTFCSTEVWSIIREYERTSTAIANAYVQPLVARYLARGPWRIRGLTRLAGQAQRAAGVATEEAVRRIERSR